MKKNRETHTYKRIREPAVAGMFYTDSPDALKSQIEEFLNSADVKPVEGDIFALVSPHAGYSYSGQVAAFGYKLLKGKKYDTVIIMGPNHRVRGFSGTSVYAQGAFKTPLGLVPVDTEFAEAMITAEPALDFNEMVHRHEHSVEVQIPFLQLLFKDIQIVPIVMGDYSQQACQKLAGAIIKTHTKFPDKKLLLIASTDLAHGHPYDTTVSMDKLAINDIIELNEKKLTEHYKTGACELCGYGPAVTTIMAAKQLGYTEADLLKYTNSLDVGGTRDWIVGYASAVIYKKVVYKNGEAQNKDASTESLEKEQYYSASERKELLNIARQSLSAYIKDGKKINVKPDNPRLREKRGAFVTLKKNGQLRGCIGYIVGVKPLHEAVAEMAVNAAVNDSRFRPVTEDELEEISIEISVMSPLKSITDINEIVVGKHGIIIRKGLYSGLLLPQVATDYGWDRKTFLQHTCAKAGLPPDAWQKGAEIQIFSAEVFDEKEE